MIASGALRLAGAVRLGGMLAVLFVAGGCSLLDPSPEATIAKEEASAFTGEQLFITNCAGCHGVNGMPNDTAVRDLRDYTGSYETFDSTLNEGPSAMPEFPQLDSMMRRRIFAHIQTLKR